MVRKFVYIITLLAMCITSSCGFFNLEVKKAGGKNSENHEQTRPPNDTKQSETNAGGNERPHKSEDQGMKSSTLTCRDAETRLCEEACNNRLESEAYIESVAKLKTCGYMPGCGCEATD